MSYKSGPPENTLTVNTTHQMLTDLEYRREGGYKHFVVYSPDRRWEKTRGYDVKLPFIKTTVFQYKRPKIPERSGWKRPKRRFSLNQDQWLTLLTLFDRGQAFFTLPNVMENSALDQSRDQTVFVDVHGILPNSSLAYVSHLTADNGKIQDFVLGKITNGPKYVIHSDFVYGWEALKEGIGDCTLGLPLRIEGAQTEEFGQFLQRIDVSTDYDEGRWWKNRLWDIIRTQESQYKEFYSELSNGLADFPEHIRGIDPLVSQVIDEISSIVSSDWDQNDVGSEVESLIDSEWALEKVDRRFEEVRDTETDPSTYGIKSSKVNMYGR